MHYYGFDWTYLVFILPCVLLSLFCQIKVSSAFSKYSQIPNSRRMTGAQAAEYVLRQNGVSGVRIEHVAGKLTDHFDPRTNVIRLSDAVYAQTSVAAVGVAAHEAGHAVQHAQNYVPNKIRGFLVPAANIGSKLSWILIMLGLIFYARIGTVLLYIGIISSSFRCPCCSRSSPFPWSSTRRAVPSVASATPASSRERNTRAPRAYCRRRQ